MPASQEDNIVVSSGVSYGYGTNSNASTIYGYGTNSSSGYGDLNGVEQTIGEVSVSTIKSTYTLG